MTSDETTFAIMEQDIPARYELIHIDQLRFLPDNPRVYAAIREMSDFATLTPDEMQHRIYQRLLQEPSVKNLIPEIQRDGGLQEPIIVRWDTQEVIEGNSRLAAYRKLRENNDDDRWTLIRCLVVSTFTDDQQIRLLGQTHLHGKTEWSPYAKALFCFRWVNEEQKDIPTLAKLSGFSQAEIKKNIGIIELMQENDDNTLSNFSYYNVLIRSSAISSELKDNEPLRDTLLSQIKTEEFTAQELRKRLPIIIKKPKILRKYTKGQISLENAYDRAKVSGAQQQLNKIRDDLEEIELDDIAPLEHNELIAVKLVVKRVGQSLKRVSNMIDSQLTDNSTDL